MRNLAIFPFFTFVVLIYSCSNNTEEPVVSCEKSGLQFTVMSTPSDCGSGNGSVTINAQGGSGPYTYELDGMSQSEEMFSNVAAGQFLVKLTDQNGCFVEGEVLVENSNGFQVVPDVDPAGCNTSEGAILVTAQNGVEPYAYSFNGGAKQSENMIEGLPVGEHTVMVTDAEGCSFEVNVTISTGVSYSDTIFPIFTKSCAVTDCHDGNNPLPNFNSFAIVKSLEDRIKFQTQRGTMPPPEKDPISQEEIDLIACWIDDGGLQN